MKQAIETGRNRTGMGTAPRRGGRQEENTWQAVAVPPGDGQQLARTRADYEQEADAVGTVPPPSSLKGALKTVVQSGMGRNPTALIDKLGERLAYERTGTRLYDLLFGKLESAASPSGPDSAGTLRTFRDQEAAHFHTLWECIESLGADPSVETPCADLAGVETKGLVQVISDPRTTFAQALDAMLIAELGDNEGWRLLITLAEGMGQDAMADRFRTALADEDIHLMTLRKWWIEINLA